MCSTTSVESAAALCRQCTEMFLASTSKCTWATWTDLSVQLICNLCRCIARSAFICWSRDVAKAEHYYEDASQGQYQRPDQIRHVAGKELSVLSVSLARAAFQVLPHCLQGVSYCRSSRKSAKTTTPMYTCRDFCVVMSPTMVVQPLTVRIGSKSMPMIRLLIGMCFTAT